MTRPRVATILSVRPWESTFVDTARSTSLVRLVARAQHPADLDGLGGALDVIVAGAETPWVTPTIIKKWRSGGLSVLGLHPPNDRPAHRLLTIGGADAVLPDTTPSDQILQVVRTLEKPVPAESGTGTMTAVTGSRGAPGISEVALSLAWGLAEHRTTLLIDLDRHGPSLSVRLGVFPAPDVAHAADEILLSGVFPSEVRRIGPLSLLAGPPMRHSGPLAPGLVHEVIRAAEGTFERIVIDLGVCEPDDPLLYRAGSRILTCEATPKGLVRAAATVEEWAAPLPALVLNQVPAKREIDAVRAARHWLGLEPEVLLPHVAEVQEAGRVAGPPSRRLVTLLERLHNPVPANLD